MNVNLISPVENGNNFVIRFKDDIIIPQNSKVYLNFASFSRENDVELYEDQTITIVIDSSNPIEQERNIIRPESIPVVPFIKNVGLATKSFVIPAGTYNYQRLYEKITSGINSLLTNPLNPSDLSMYKAVAIADIDNNDAQIAQGEVKFSIGIMKQKSTLIPKADIILDDDNKRNCDGVGVNGEEIGYRKTSATPLTPSGLRKNSTGKGAFNPDFNIGLQRGTTDKTFGDYTDVPLTSLTGVGAGGSVDYSVNEVGGIKTFFGGFENIGNNTGRTNGSYTGINLTYFSGTQGSGATINFDVVGGEIIYNTIVINNDGINYRLNSVLRISPNASTTGGSATGCGGDDSTMLRVDTTTFQMNYSTLKVNQRGDGYVIGDQVRIGADGDAGSGTTADLILVYGLQINSTLPFFDNYALSKQHYWHIGYNDGTPFNNANVISFQTSNDGITMGTDNGCVQIGLYSSEYAKGLRGLTNSGIHNNAFDFGGRTHGTQATNNNANGKAFTNPLFYPTQDGGQQGVINNSAPFLVSVNCRPAVSVLEVWLGLNNTNNLDSSVKNWLTPNQKIMKMRKVYSIPLNSVVGYYEINKFKGGIQLYYDKNSLEDRRVYFRVLNLNIPIDSSKSIDDQPTLILYDSRNTLDAQNGTYFNDNFFECPVVEAGVKLIDYETSGAGTIITKTQGTPDKTPNVYNAQPIAIVQRMVDGVSTNINSFGLKVDFSVDNTGAIINVVPSAGELGTNIKVGDTFQISSVITGGTQDDVFEITAQSLEPRSNRINSQMPFNVYASALTQYDGFDYISAPFKEKDNTKPLTFLESYELECTEELSRYLNLNTSDNRAEGLSQTLFPNSGDALDSNIIHVENMNLDWRNESYSISLKELPIKNYKNNDSLKNGGFSKTILANCPVPFSDAQSYSTKSKQMITSTYKPNYQVINNLYNQAMTTNHFSVEIRKMSSDRPANEIKKSVVNFTIMPPDDYTGNINSVDLLKNV